ncbi:AMP-binding protein [Prauserella alba]|uniref:AMP-dependent synthetase/ligase domain-containing protein n=1 Tax=Prauserella alba TaxID=176898 RepID=A0ABN1VP63_9PSEU
MTAAPTVAELLLARAGRRDPGLKTHDGTWTWDEVVAASAARGAAVRELLRTRPGDGPPHVGILADNSPEFAFLLGGCALSGSVLVGLNPTRRGPALARDVRVSDCRVVLTQTSYRPLLDVDPGG